MCNRLRISRVLLAALAALAPVVAYAHERFVKHELKHPLHDEWFRQSLLHNPDMAQIGANVAVVLAVFLITWQVRIPLEQLAQAHVLGRLGGRVQQKGHLLACFLTDRPVRHAFFQVAREWAVIMFLRSPGLVLMYAAATNSLVMPSYPLEPSSAAVFQFAQVGLAILILTQTLLPLAGAVIFGTWLYLFRWGWYVAADALPVLTVAVVYVTSPWQSHKLAITDLDDVQIKWVRRILGLSFLVLGWLKVYNHDLVAGVADNYPSVMNDPLVNFFALGTDPAYRRETWVVSFGMAEVLSGFLLTIGVFSRVWGVMMAFVFTKLMLVDFGWEEIPHIYPIGALLAVVFSNRLSSDLSPIEAKQWAALRDGDRRRRIALVAIPALIIALAVVFPGLEILTHTDRAALKGVVQ